MIKLLLSLSRRIDSLNYVAGIAANWLVLLAALVCALDAILRYGLGSLVSLSGKFGVAGQAFDWLFTLYRDNSNTLRAITHPRIENINPDMFVDF